MSAVPQEPEITPIVTRDDRFYMSLATFQVEDCLFRVPRQILQSQSTIFRDMFSLPATNNAEGLSDDNPICLDGIKRADFRRFLEVICMGPQIETPLIESSSIFEAWFPVVKLAHMWGCDELHKYASTAERVPYGQCSKPAVEKVAMALQHDIKSWLRPGLNELSRRQEPIGVDDVNILGLDIALKVAAVRESLLVTGSRSRESADFTSAIEEIFKLPTTSGPAPSNSKVIQHRYDDDDWG